MIQQAIPRSLLEELETRHDEVLDQLDALNERIEAALMAAGGGRLVTGATSTEPVKEVGSARAAQAANN